MEFANYWKSVWNNPEAADLDAPWLKQVQRGVSELIEMEQPIISRSDIENVLKKAKNWKAPGPDKIHNFWLKSFTSTHGPLSRCFQKFLEDPTSFPKFFAAGRTTLIFKKETQMTLKCTDLSPVFPRYINFCPLCLTIIYTDIVRKTGSYHQCKRVAPEARKAAKNNSS